MIVDGDYTGLNVDRIFAEDMRVDAAANAAQIFGKHQIKLGRPFNQIEILRTFQILAAPLARDDLQFPRNIDMILEPPAIVRFLVLQTAGILMDRTDPADPDDLQHRSELWDKRRADSGHDEYPLRSTTHPKIDWHGVPFDLTVSENPWQTLTNPDQPQLRIPEGT